MTDKQIDSFISMLDKIVNNALATNLMLLAILILQMFILYKLFE